MISSIVAFNAGIIVTIYFLIKIWKVKKKKNKIKKIFDSEEFNFLTSSANELEKKKTKDKLNEKVSQYFKNLFIYEFNIKIFFNFISTEIGKGKKSTKIAWEFFILLTTSVLANESKGLISEAVSSIFNIYQKSRALLFETESSNLITDIILKILNLKIRPILTSSRHLPQIERNNILIVDDNKLTEPQKNNFWQSIENLRTDLIENKYLKFISLASLSSQTNDDIIKLLNYSNNYKQDKKTLKLEKEINESVDKLNELIFE